MKVVAGHYRRCGETLWTDCDVYGNRQQFDNQGLAAIILVQVQSHCLA